MTTKIFAEQFFLQQFSHVSGVNISTRKPPLKRFNSTHASINNFTNNKKYRSKVLLRAAVGVDYLITR